MGTGDGRAVVARAMAEPGTLVIGIDAQSAAMAEASRRAARPARKGGLPNALFVAAAAECPPPELSGLAELVTIALPWGSLLDGVLGRSMTVTCGIATLVAPDGRIEALVSTTTRDGRDLPTLDDSIAPGIARAWAAAGLCLDEFRPATAGELLATRSSWARRLRLGAAGEGGRGAWKLVLSRPSGTPTGSIGA